MALQATAPVALTRLFQKDTSLPERPATKAGG
jgi:hypothetical protein